jgi:hypothetical protein
MSAVIASPTRRRSMMKLRHVLIIWGIHLFDKGCLTKVFSIDCLTRMRARQGSEPRLACNLHQNNAIWTLFYREQYHHHVSASRV